jgi:hypothetical protein
MDFSEYEDDDLEDGDGALRRTDPAALRILASWIAQHDGLDPTTGVVFDRDFVLVDVPTMSAQKLR